MAKQIKQFRYYDDAGKKSSNQPEGLNKEALGYGGDAFTNIAAITQLGIQTLPGTRFHLNNADSPIIVGSTGIYELELEGISEITSLWFEMASLEAISNNQNAYLIIDMICEPR